MTLHHPHTRRRVAMLAAAAMLAVVGCTADDNGTGIAPLPDDIAPVTNDEPATDEPEPDAEVEADVDPEPEGSDEPDVEALAAVARDEVEALVRTQFDLLDAYEAGDADFDMLTAHMTPDGAQRAAEFWSPDPDLHAGVRVVYDVIVELNDDLTSAEGHSCVHDQRRIERFRPDNPDGAFHEVWFAAVTGADGDWQIDMMIDPLAPNERVRRLAACLPQVYFEQISAGAADMLRHRFEDTSVDNAPDFGIGHRFGPGTNPMYSERIYEAFTGEAREWSRDEGVAGTSDLLYATMPTGLRTPNWVEINLCVYALQSDVFVLSDGTHFDWLDEPLARSWRLSLNRGEMLDGTIFDDWTIEGIRPLGEGWRCNTDPADAERMQVGQMPPNAERHPDAPEGPLDIPAA